ncbi:hypothetical protein B0187_05255 [Haemophilus paracuniculus]|uniref:UDP-N-acetylglucosamine kinase n=1 Tax=Haemophilus paracuniculus TaxID=734 RepID=A0A1T0ASG2_9PAST|nr:AAA family ATPase [Haemophilus paracuniculus]OOR99165.1 hypothetical protein B0187_05255 [Haemophilus paracuniculus]
MQKLIIVRGHSGSGKSTFAHTQIATFQQQQPQGVCFHIENDHFISENGHYHWTKDRFKQAKQQGEQAVQDALNYAKQHANQAVLIVLSNVGVNVAYIRALCEQAERQGMACEIYRMENFFQNQHNVGKYRVYQMYLAIQQNPIEGEIFVQPIQPITPKIQREIEKMRFRREQKRKQAV